MSQNAKVHNQKLPRSVSVQFHHQSAELNKTYYISALEDSVAITTLKFYISNISFSGNDIAYVQEDQRYYLIDLEDLSSLKRSIKLPAKANYNTLSFSIGVDSTTQTDGAKGGELDPTNGMYWSWQSGYINFKLEGTTQSCPARNNTFQFHIGGYQHPYNTLQATGFEVDNLENVIIEINLNKILTKENITTHYQIMSPNTKAMKFAENLPNTFSLVP